MKSEELMYKAFLAIVAAGMPLIGGCAPTQPKQTDNAVAANAATSIIFPKPGAEAVTAAGNIVAWDQIQHRGTMIWTCREIATGKFLNRDACASQPKEDNVWPDKKVPGYYKSE